MGLTLGEIYRQGKTVLLNAGNETPAFDAACLFRNVFGLDRQSLVIHSGEPAEAEKTERYLGLVRERADGRPLQYILGSWPFMELTLEVGEGVLIPREETELLVTAAAQLLKGTGNPQIIDLCSGTGAVALGLASLFPCASIYAAELYDKAFDYLNLNIKNTGFQNVKAVQTDILNLKNTEKFSAPDCIVSNPPYVTTGELKALQSEVQREPQTALDGGRDGLLFYRAIASLWIPKLKRSGIAAVEVGEGQAAQVSELFQDAGLSKIRILKDFNNIERVVTGINDKD